MVARQARLALASLVALGCPAASSDAGGGDDAGKGTGDSGDTTAAGDEGSTGSADGGSSTGGMSADGGSSDGSSGSSDGGTPVEIPDPVPDDCITDVSAGHHVFPCMGFDFDIEIPEQCIGYQCGLVVDVHGYTMDADMQDANTRMRALGRKHGYVVVQPNANPDPPNSSWQPYTDDPAVQDFAMRAVDAFHLDPARLHFTGFSQGGFMSWRFLCAYGDVYASIAPGAACDGTASLDGCVDADPDILYIHGINDVLVPYAGCAEPQRDAVLAAYGIDGDPETIADGGGYRDKRWTGDSGTVVETIDHDYRAMSPILGGHCFPGSDDLDGGLPGQFLPFACVDEAAFDYGETVMAFFIAHPKG